MMGLFDGAADGTGSAADFATAHNLPIILVVDAAKQSQSIAALVHGFVSFRPDAQVRGIILNKIGRERHETMLRDALSSLDIAILGAIPRDSRLELPERHLGLVQASEMTEIDTFLNSAADLVEEKLDFVKLMELAGQAGERSASTLRPVPLTPPAQRLAVARDVAFAFAYEHVLQGWRDAGCEISFFSPLADEAPSSDADFVFLPGGYPELHAGILAGNENFLMGLRDLSQTTKIYGECGGYMVLGDGLIDKQGKRHQMAGLLPVTTSFADRKLHLGYRKARVAKTSPVWAGEAMMAHEFHYTSAVDEGRADPLFVDVQDARGANLADMGQSVGNIAGSYLHIICEASG